LSGVVAPGDHVDAFGGHYPGVDGSYILARVPDQPAWRFSTTQAGSILLPGFCVSDNSDPLIAAILHFSITVTCFQGKPCAFGYSFSRFSDLVRSPCEWQSGSDFIIRPAGSLVEGVGSATGALLGSGSAAAPKDCLAMGIVVFDSHVKIHNV
jgi:hypothetical protein